ncbi:MAG: DUF5615 family PIN-like protein [Gemmatimonadota bacterium]|nr:DUF5615 family PIN-like protein [Gemmatimonadota bacterium]
MHILFDENMDRRLKNSLDVNHTILTVQECGWSGKENGELLSLAQHEFDVFITMDQSIEYQQSLTQFDLSIIFLKAFTNRRVDVEPLMSQVNKLLDTIQPGAFLYLSHGDSTR